MRIVSLEPYLTELVQQLGAAASLVGVTERCNLKKLENVKPAVVASVDAASGSSDGTLQKYLAEIPVNLAALKDCKPDIVLTLAPHGVILPNDARGGGGDITLDDLRKRLKTFLGNENVKLLAVRPTRLESIYSMYEEVGVLISQPAHGRERSQRLKAQLMDWGDNFYERTKNKKVSFLSSLNPLMLGGLWIPDLIALCSATSQHAVDGSADREVSWEEVVAFKPDVIVVAPRGKDLKESLATFKELSKLPRWEEVPAVVRGEVIFSDGTKHFYDPVSGFMDSMAILLSGVAGFESGYIAERDTFYRLRWLELHRHKL